MPHQLPNPVAGAPLFTPTYTSVEKQSSAKADSPSEEVSPHEYRNILCMSCGHVLTIPVYCGDRFCPICSSGRAKRIRAKLAFCVARQRRTTGCTFKHLTLTIKNSDNLPSMVKHLVASFRRLRQRAVWKKTVIGGAFVVEVTGGKGNWHAHIHCLMYSYYFPWEKILKAWRKVSGGQHMRINMMNPKACAAYLTKYVTKEVDWSPEDRRIVSDTLKGYRLFNPFGSWYKLSAEYKPEPCGCPKCGGHSWISKEYLEHCNRYDAIYIEYLMKKENVDEELFRFKPKMVSAEVFIDDAKVRGAGVGDAWG